MAAASFDSEFQRHGGAGSGPLGVHAASRKIGKPGGAGHAQQQQERRPVIIYMVSPKVIHVEAHEFMPLVQRLTGPDHSGGRANKKRGRPSTSSWAQEPEGKQQGRTAAPPVRVKARALNRPAGGPAVSVSVTATKQLAPAAGPSSGAAVPSPSSTRLMFHDLSPLRGAALKGEHPLVSPGWLHHVSDHFLSPGAAGSPSAAFLDIFGPMSSQH